MTNTQVSSVDLFKEVMGNYPSGVTVITTTDANNAPVGLTANSFVSVSIDPLLILWCIDKRSGSYEAFDQSEHFAVNILAADQADVCWTFASKTEENRFSKTPWHEGNHHVPVLDEAFASLECKKHNVVDAGDHYILIGEVINISKNDVEPMLYHKRAAGAVPASFYEK